MSKTDTKPNIARYLFDAQLNYLVDAGYDRIYMAADCTKEGVVAFRNDKVINFAIQADAVKHFITDNDGVSFEGRFDGRVMHSFFPWDSVVGVFPPDETIYHFPILRDPWGIEYMKRFASSPNPLASAQDQRRKDFDEKLNGKPKTQSKLRIVE